MNYNGELKFATKIYAVFFCVFFTYSGMKIIQISHVLNIYIRFIIGRLVT